MRLYRSKPFRASLEEGDFFRVPGMILEGFKLAHYKDGWLKVNEVLRDGPGVRYSPILYCVAQEIDEGIWRLEGRMKKSFFLLPLLFFFLLSATSMYPVVSMFFVMLAPLLYVLLCQMKRYDSLIKVIAEVERNK